MRKLTTETGAGQWGSALALACRMFGLECEVWQVAASYDQKPYRASMMRTWGAAVHSSPSEATNAGRAILEQDPDSPGSLGIAISEAVEVAATNEDVNYSLGSVLNHVLLHQTVIGQEASAQLAKAGEGTPDVVIGCTGGGSNFSGLSFPFIREKLAGNSDPTIKAVEPAACPSITKGEYRYDFGDAIDDAVEKMPQLEDVFVRFIERQELANDIFSDDIAAKADTDSILGKLIELGKTETYSKFPQMVVNYNETRKKFQNELRSVAKDVIDTGQRIYNPAQRLDAYCHDLLSHSDFREFIGLT